MLKVLFLLQFVPLSVFLGVARSHGFSDQGWELGFELGALAGVLQLAILLPILRNRLNRLIVGANLFLVLGGTAFYFDISTLLTFIDTLRGSAVILSLGFVCSIATLTTNSGVFEGSSSEKLEMKYSLYFLAGILGAFIWSFTHKSEPLLGGAVPFLFLVILKNILQRIVNQTSNIDESPTSVS